MSGAPQPTPMDVELRFFATFREAVGQKVLEREVEGGTTVGDVLDDLVAEYDLDVFEDGDIRPQVSVMKNGKDVYHLDGIDTVLEDGDAVSVFPPVAGG